MTLADIFPLVIEHVAEMPGDDVSRALARKGWDLSPYASKARASRPELFLARRHGGSDGGKLLAAAAVQVSADGGGRSVAIVSAVRTPGPRADTAAGVMQILLSTAIVQSLTADVPVWLAFEVSTTDPASTRALTSLRAEKSEATANVLRSGLGRLWLPTHEGGSSGWLATAETIRQAGATILEPSLICSKPVILKSGAYHRRLQAELPAWFSLYSDLIKSMAAGYEAKMALPELRIRAANE